MATTIHIQVEDVEEKLLEYDRFEIERGSSPTGPWTAIDSVLLQAGVYFYTYTDLNGQSSHYYRYRFTDAGSNPTEYSNPFKQVGVTRQDIRQTVLKNYKSGIVFPAVWGTSSTIQSTDYRVKSSDGWRTGRGAGTWIYPITGANAFMPNRLSAESNPVTGMLELATPYPDTVDEGDLIEWHWLADPEVLNDAINEGLKRYWFIDSIPINGISNANEYDLYNIAPWVINYKQIHGLWHYPSATLVGDRTGIPLPWGSNGSWWNIRQDAHSIKIVISPTITEAKTLWLDVARQMPELHTDDSVLPEVANVDICAAFAWDEI